MGIAPEGIEGPHILTFVMTQDVQMAVVGAHPEAAVSDPVPLVKDFLDFVGDGGLRQRGEAQWPLVSFVAGVTLDLEDEAHGPAR